MDTTELTRKLIELRLATRLACMCEDGDKQLISLKTKLLFVLSSGIFLTPPEIRARLRISRPNLTAMSQEMEEEGLLVRSKPMNDHRLVCYSVSDKGTEYLNTRLRRINERFAQLYSDEESIAAAVQKLADAVDLLSFLDVQ
jgi:DNA-binding MarR family transcriptional regulator